MTDRQAKQFSLAHTMQMERIISGTISFKPGFGQYYLVGIDLSAAADRTVQHGHDVVWEESGQWFHTDETWTDKYGPFATEGQADAALRAYCQQMGIGH